MKLFKSLLLFLCIGNTSISQQVFAYDEATVLKEALYGTDMVVRR
jgi:hypothetical protein